MVKMSERDSNEELEFSLRHVVKQTTIVIQYKCGIYVLFSEERSQFVIQIWDLWKSPFACPDVFVPTSLKIDLLGGKFSGWSECTDPHLDSVHIYIYIYKTHFGSI